MLRIGLHPGVWASALGLVFGGIFAVLAATQTQNALLAAGWLSIAAGVTLVVWGIKFDGEHWWARNRIRMTWPYALMIASGSVFAIGAFFAYWQKSPAALSDTQLKKEALNQVEMPSKSDFGHAITKADILPGPKLAPSHVDVPNAALETERHQQPMRDSYVNNGINNGIMGPVTIGKPPFQLTDSFVQDAIARIGSAKSVDISTVGQTQEAFSLGEAFVNALAGRGVQVQNWKRIGQLIRMPPPQKPLDVEMNGDTAIVVFDPS